MATKTPTVTRTSRAEDMATIGFSLWVVIGLFVDAYNHVTNPRLESFWTPWHGLFYSGFLALAAWLVFLRLRRRPAGDDDLFWAPQGYRQAMYGIGLFAAGGIGDAIWHEVFGVETSLDALLSPTHLLLYVGLSLIISAPLRARWLDQDLASSSPGYRDFFPALVSLAFTVTLSAFFFEYAWAPAQTWPATIPYDPATNSEEWAAFGFLTILTATVITFVPLLAVTRRWRLPFGAVTTYLAIINLLIAVGFDKEFVALPSVLVAGVTMDLLIARRAARWMIAAVPPLVMWLAYFALIDIDGALGWPPELWGGSTFFAVLAALGADRLLGIGAETATSAAAELPKRAQT